MVPTPGSSGNPGSDGRGYMFCAPAEPYNAASPIMEQENLDVRFLRDAS